MSNKKFSHVDVCFVVPSSAKKAYQKLADVYSAIEPPTWALLLAQSMRSVGFSVKIIDANAEQLSEKEIYERILKITPKLICLVVYGQNVNAGTANMSGAVHITNYLKQKKINANRQKNLIQGSFRSDKKVISVCLHY